MRVHYLRLKPFSDQQLKEITLHQISLYDYLHQESLAVLAKRELLSILTITVVMKKQ